MDIRTLQWDEELCEEVGVPLSILPEIRPSIGDFGHVRAADSLARVPVTGVLGDQQAALFGQAACEEGEAKNSCGTGLFMLLDTGAQPRWADNGLLTTLALQSDGQKPGS